VVSGLGAHAAASATKAQVAAASATTAQVVAASPAARIRTRIMRSGTPCRCSLSSTATDARGHDRVASLEDRQPASVTPCARRQSRPYRPGARDAVGEAAPPGTRLGNALQHAARHTLQQAARPTVQRAATVARTVDGYGALKRRHRPRTTKSTSAGTAANATPKRNPSCSGVRSFGRVTGRCWN